MSLRINSDFNGVTDPDAGAYIAAVEAADGQLLEFAVGKAINDFVVGCKNDGIWNAIKASCILAGARTLSGALVPLAGTAPTNFNFVSGDYNRKTGLVGDGSTKYLNSNRNSNSEPLNSQHAACFVSTSPSTAASGTNNFAVFLSAGASSGETSFGRLNSNSANYFARSRRADLSFDSVSGAGNTGFAGLSRSSSSQYNFRTGGQSAIISSNSSILANSTFSVFRDSNNSVSYNNGRLAFYSIGEAIDLAKLDSRVTAMITAFGAAIP